ncbi:unnamed protein product [Musa acuminata subsp. burmannicoides]
MLVNTLSAVVKTSSHTSTGSPSRARRRAMARRTSRRRSERTASLPPVLMNSRTVTLRSVRQRVPWGLQSKPCCALGTAVVEAGGSWLAKMTSWSLSTSRTAAGEERTT